MLILRAGDSFVGGRHTGGLELRLGLGDIGLDGNPAEIAVGGDAEGFLVLRDGVVQQLLL